MRPKGIKPTGPASTVETVNVQAFLLGIIFLTAGGYEWLEHPQGSDEWYWHDQDTGGWVRY